MITPRSTSEETAAAEFVERATGVVAILVPWLLLALAAGVLGWTLFFLSDAVDLGPELSDSAFYVLMREEYLEIDGLLTGFGLLVAALSGEASGQSIRVATLIFTFTAPLALLVPVFLSARRQGDSLPLLFAGLIAAVAGSGAYYKWLLMDPSYNGLILPVTFTAAGALWVLWSAAKSGKSIKAIAASLVLGASLFSLLLLKISSGLAFVVVALPIFTCAGLWQSRFSARQAFGALVLVVSGVLIGGLVSLSLLVAATLPLSVLCERFVSGFETVSLLASHDVSPGALLKELFDTLAWFIEDFFEEPLTLLLPLLCLTLAQTPLYDQRRHVPMIVAVVALLGICALVAEHMDDFANMAQRAWVFALGASILIWFATGRDLRLALFANLLAWAPYGLSLGTANMVIRHGAIFTGASIAALFLVALALKRGRRTAMAATVLIGVGLTLSALDQAASKPYRMLGPLSAATERVEAGGEVWRVTPPIAATYQAMSELRQTPEWRGAQLYDRPILLDLSGRAPALNWIGNFRVPSFPWILSGYEGSNDLLAWALEELSDEDLQNMWLAVDMPGPEGTRRGLSTDVLNDRLQSIGLQFPDDYRSVGPTVPIAYTAQQVVVYQAKQ